VVTDLDLLGSGRERRDDRPLDFAALEGTLREQVDGEVRFDAGSRGAYSTDASNYRQVPIGVVVPRTAEAGAVAVGVCRQYGAPVLSRGGGTSLGGQCTNTAVVVDWTKYCRQLVSVDVAARTCVVEPGIVLDDLNAHLAEHGLALHLAEVLLPAVDRDQAVSPRSGGRTVSHRRPT
jgi:FAD/FMN-containing dehydrogenase